MTEERVEKLESVGFQWSLLKDLWNERFEELKEYKAEHGHCNVPYRNESNKALGIWVYRQRHQYKKMLEGSHSHMTRERMTMLENIGFEWKLKKNVPKHTSWDERLRQLKNFKAKHGHCNVPQKYEPNRALGHWVSKQRCQYTLMVEGAKSPMTEERVEKLDNIGFDWQLIRQKVRSF